jgi:hypothetical protein
MKVNKLSKAEEFIKATAWVFNPGTEATERRSFTQAFDYFIANVPAAVLNKPDFSSPFGPPDRTYLFALLQGIDMRLGVNPARPLPPAPSCASTASRATRPASSATGSRPSTPHPPSSRSPTSSATPAGGS